MAGRAVGLIAVCLLYVDGLMLPPGIPPAGDVDVLARITNPKNQLIRLPCPACAFPPSQTEVENGGNEEGVSWISGGPQELVLNFSVSSGGDRLELNGDAVYPLQFHRDAYLQGHPIYVNQVSAAASDAEIAAGEARRIPLEVTSSGLNIEFEHSVSTDGDVFIPLKLRIMGLERQPMLLDEVGIDLLKTGDGKLFILKVGTFPNPAFPPPPGPQPDTSDVDDCDLLPFPLCRLKHMIEAKIAAMRHANFGHSRHCTHRNGPPGDLPTQDGSYFDTLDFPKRPHGYFHRSHHHRSHGNHRFFHALMRGFITVLIPIMAGILAGLTVSLFGLVVGRLVRYLWIKFARGGQCGYASIAQEDGDRDGDKNLTNDDDMEPLPIYEEAPAYEETVAELK